MDALVPQYFPVGVFGTGAPLAKATATSSAMICRMGDILLGQLKGTRVFRCGRDTTGFNKSAVCPRSLGPSYARNAPAHTI